jgi:hypothetical protein
MGGARHHQMKRSIQQRNAPDDLASAGDLHVGHMNAVTWFFVSWWHACFMAKKGSSYHGGDRQ